MVPFVLILWSFAILGLFALCYLLVQFVSVLAKLQPFRLKRVFGICVWSCCGLFMVVGILSFTIFLWNEWHHHDYFSVDCRYLDFSSALNSSDYPKAYSFMSPGYRSTHTLEQFKKEWGPVNMPQLWPGRSISIRGKMAELYPYTTGRFGDLLPGPYHQFVKVGDEWYLTGEVEWYLD